MSSPPSPAQPAPGSRKGQSRSDSVKAAPGVHAGGGPHVLTSTVLALLSIGVALGLVFAWSGYADRYAQLTDGWRLGGTRLVEITLIPQDKDNLACASDMVIGGLHCAYRSSHQPFGPADEAHTLRPYNTTGSELFLGGGLWSLPVLQGQLPRDRFSVACNYTVLGVAKSVSLRWSPTGSFDPLKPTITVGRLSDCVIPQ
jgi:hypothetical protein